MQATDVLTGRIMGQTISPANGQTTGQTTGLRVIKRDGRIAPFDAAKIAAALGKAFLAVEGEAARGSSRVHETVERLTLDICAAIDRRQVARIAIEDIQDLAELALMRGGHHKAARAYVLWREARAADRAQPAAKPQR